MTEDPTFEELDRKGVIPLSGAASLAFVRRQKTALERGLTEDERKRWTLHIDDEVWERLAAIRGRRGVRAFVIEKRAEEAELARGGPP